MFENLIYFISAVFITSTYMPESPRFSVGYTLLIIIASYLSFYLYLKIKALSIEKRINNFTLDDIINKIDLLKRNGSITAIVLYTFFIFYMNISAVLPYRLIHSGLQSAVPLSLLLLFVLFMIILWTCIFRLQKKIIDPVYSLPDYIKSNLTFPVSALIPWIMVSILSDLTNFIPEGNINVFLHSEAGEVIYLIFVLLVVMVIIPFIVPKIWGCKSLTDESILDRIYSLCTKANVKISNVLEWPILGGSVITAAVLGFFSQARFVLVTPALTKFLSPEEFDSVISHEIGHIRKKHVILYIFILAGFGMLLYGITEIIMIPFSFFIGSGLVAKILNSLDNSLIVSVVSLASACLFIPFFRYGFGFIMRSCERQADAFAFELTGTTVHLISTFKKIANLNRIPINKPSWHHYSIGERIDFLEKCEADHSLIKRHNYKVTKTISLYFILVLTFASMGYVSSNSEFGKKIKNAGFEKGLLYSVKKNPKNYKLLTAIGDYYYSTGDFKHAEKNYLKSISVFSNDAYTLNNLAWLLVTAKDPEIYNPKKALKYSLKAVELEPSPRILDTLAECYYKNNLKQKAIETAEKALGKSSSEDRNYLKRQLKKFKS